MARPSATCRRRVGPGSLHVRWIRQRATTGMQPDRGAVCLGGHHAGRERARAVKPEPQTPVNAPRRLGRLSARPLGDQQDIAAGLAARRGSDRLLITEWGQGGGSAGEAPQPRSSTLIHLVQAGSGRRPSGPPPPAILTMLSPAAAYRRQTRQDRLWERHPRRSVPRRSVASGAPRPRCYWSNPGWVSQIPNAPSIASASPGRRGT